MKPELGQEWEKSLIELNLKNYFWVKYYYAKEA